MDEPMDGSNVGLPGCLFEGPQYLIVSEPGGALRVDPVVLAEVAKLDKDLVIVCVAGLYRTGKSYLMNRLAGKSSGFDLGSTTVSVTKGIWIWVRHHPECPDKYLVLLDTEGLGDPMKGDPDHDCAIFCLATLLSSVLIYNATGVIDDNSLAKLNFISEMSQHIHTHKEGKPAGESNDEDFDYYFPYLIYVLRDFSLDCEIDGTEVSSDEYLEHCLSLKEDSAQGEIQTYNEVRRCIRRYFKNRKCFTFDRPGSRSQLKAIESQNDSDLSPDFVEEVTRFCQHIFMTSPAKKLETGQTLNGRMWSAMIQTYVEAIRNGTVPCIENAVVAMATIENTRAGEETVALYQKLMSEVVTLPTPDDKTLSDLHQKTLKVAIKHFLDKAVFDNDSVYQEKANDKILEEYAKIVAANKQASASKCREALSRLEQPLVVGLKNGDYSKPGGHKQYLGAVDDILRQFHADQGLGTEKEIISLEYKALKLREGEGIMAADLALTEKERLAEAERQKAAAAEQERAEAESARQQAQQASQERERTLQENMRQLEEKNKEELDTLQKHNESILTARLEEQKRLLQEGFNSQAASLKQEIQNLQNRPPPRRRRRRKWWKF